MKKSILCGILIMLLLAVAVHAMSVPKATNYQGRLTDSNGDPLPDGVYNVSLSIYHMENGGSPVYTDSRSVEVTDGLFDFILNVPELALTDTSFCYLGISVNGEEILPRTQILSSAFAMHAQHGGGWKFNQSGYSSNTIHTDETIENMKVGINNTDPEQELTVGSQNLGTFFGTCVTISSLDSNSGLLIGQDLNDRVAITRSADDRFSITTRDAGITRRPISIYQGNVGIGIPSDDASEPLVIGKDLGSFSGNRLVIGDDNPGTQTGLVFGESGNDRAWMLWDVDDNLVTLGSKHSGTNYSDALTIQNGCVGLGIEPVTYSILRMDRGYNSTGSRYVSSSEARQAGTGTVFGIWTKAHRTSSSSTSNRTYGLYGIATNDNQVGYTQAVYGYASGGSDAIAIEGYVTGGLHYNWAGYFDGDAIVTGTFYQKKSAFRIDHPLDPENEYLCHSAVNSPDMKNVYDGVVILGADGGAVVNLPEYFEALNKDFRYQLTCIGGYAPVYIAEKISNNRFEIAGGKPGMEISWQITGIRKDPAAEDGRISVEVEKFDHEKGLYLYPEGYGYGEERSVNYKSRRAAREAAEIGGEE